MISAGPVPSAGNAIAATPTGTAGSPTTGRVSDARAAVIFTSVPLSTPSAARSCGLTRRTLSGTSSGERGRLADDAPVVVERPPDDEPERVAVPRRHAHASARRDPIRAARARRRGRDLGFRVDHGRVLILADVGRGLTLDLDRVPRGSLSVLGQDRELAGPEHDLVDVLTEREHDAVARPPEKRGVGAELCGRDPGHFVGDLVHGGEVEVAAEPVRELDRDPPVVHRGALGRDLAADPLHAVLEVGDRCPSSPPRACTAGTRPRGGWSRTRTRRPRSRSRRRRRRVARDRHRGSRRADPPRGARAPGSCRRRPRRGSRPRPGPRAAGVAPQCSANHSAPASSATRPGSNPGASPAPSAPCTFPRRSADKKRTSVRSASARADPTVMSADSANDVRPSTTTTGPGRSPRACAICSSSAAPTPAPGASRPTVAGERRRARDRAVRGRRAGHRAPWPRA